MIPSQLVLGQAGCQEQMRRKVVGMISMSIYCVREAAEDAPDSCCLANSPDYSIDRP